MRLRTLEPFWLIKNGLIHSYPSLYKDLKADFVVVGAGITGALISHALMEMGHEVIVVDKRDVATGSTAATTSMLQYEIDVSLQELSNMIGGEKAALCYKAGVDAVKQLEQLTHLFPQNDFFKAKQSLYVAHDEKQLDFLKKECDLRKAVGIQVEWLTTEVLKYSHGVHAPGAILSQTAASIDAYRLTHELLQYNVRRGMQVYDQSPISEFEFKKGKSIVKFESCCQIDCRHVIFCNGFEATGMLKENIAKLFYTYATVSEQNIDMPPTMDKMIMWDTDDPYLYWRTTADGRLLAGGKDSALNWPFGQQKKKELKSEQIIDSLQRYYPYLNFIEDFSWGGTFGSTKDGLPYIGVSPEYPEAFFVLGFGGNGITFSVQAMQLVQHLLRGEEHPLLDAYRFGR